MEFAKSEIHQSIEELAQQIFRDQVDDDYHKQAGVELDDFDRALWGVLAEAGLLGATVGEDFGGSGMGFIELGAVLEAQGAVLARLPLWQSAVAADVIERFAAPELAQEYLPRLVSGQAHFALALAEAVRVGLSQPLRVEAGVLSGRLNDVAFYEGAALCLVPVVLDDGSSAIYLLDPARDAVAATAQYASNGESHALLALESVEIDVGRLLQKPGVDIVEHLTQRAYTAVAALQLGVVEEALRRTAAYVSERHQFNKPLASFQAVSHRAADGYIDCAALRATVIQATWRLSEGLDATAEARTAKWWACEAGHRVGHTGQHLHGGMGADVDYPIHRYFLWAKQLEYMLGGGQEQLAQLGALLAADPELAIDV